jgi:hypothetical protein
MNHWYQNAFACSKAGVAGSPGCQPTEIAAQRVSRCGTTDAS